MVGGPEYEMERHSLWNAFSIFFLEGVSRMGIRCFALAWQSVLIDVAFISS